MIPYETCKICGSKNLFVVRSFVRDKVQKSICQCRICDFAYDIEDNRRAVYDDAYFDSYVVDDKVTQQRSEEAVWLSDSVDLSGGKTYMEIGPGMGQFMAALKTRTPDLKFNAIEMAPRAAESCRQLGATVIQKDWESLPYRDIAPYYGACDIVASIHCVEHMDEPLLALQKMVWMLKPGGLLYIHVPDHDFAHDENWFFYIAEHIALFGEMTMRVAFERANVRPICVRKFNKSDLIVLGTKKD